MVNPSHFEMPKTSLMQRLDLSQQRRTTRYPLKIGGIGSNDDQQRLGT